MDRGKAVCLNNSEGNNVFVYNPELIKTGKELSTNLGSVCLVNPATGKPATEDDLETGVQIISGSGPIKGTFTAVHGGG